MYLCVCDGCGKSHMDEFNGYVAWTDGSSAREAVRIKKIIDDEMKDFNKGEIHK